jgi:hypothetical protein
MLKMKKHAWLFALLLALSMAFFACGGNGNGAELIDPPAETPSVARTDFHLLRTLTIVEDPNHAGDGKGWVEGEDFAAVLAAEENSVFRLYIFNRTNPHASRGNWGIGAIGEGEGEANRVDFDGKATTASDRVFWVDVEVDEVLKEAGDVDKLFFNIWNQCAIIMVELWEPGEGAWVPQVVWSLETWIADKTGPVAAPFSTNPGTGATAAEIVEVSGVKGINVTGRTADWHGIGLRVDATGIDLKPAERIYDVRVIGNVIGTLTHGPNTQISVTGNERPWGNIAFSGALSNDANHAFNFNGSIPANLFTALQGGGDTPNAPTTTNGFNIGVGHVDGSSASDRNDASFRITNIIIRDMGPRED